MKYHLVGIGGVGMSALATALVRLGHEVTGSDRTLATANIEFLQSRGIRCSPDDGTAIDESTDEVIVSTAIESTNRDLIRARELAIPVVHRAAALSRALAPFKLIAVVGTCGKSTVTAMLGHILAVCGRDPMCVNGANVPGWEGAVRFGRGEFAVAEVDESDKSLVAFHPYAAIVTNASADHYSKEEMDEVFDSFIRDVPGPVVDARGETYRPQDFNRQNASLAVRMAVALGVGEGDARRAMASFGGVARRLERYGERVFDDYAHNPEKLRSMWSSLAEESPRGLCVCWRPHGYAPLRKMLGELAATFAEVMRPCDALLLLPVYDAGGTTDRSINSDALAAAIGGGRVRLVADLDEALEWMASRERDFSRFAVCGARDPGLPGLARRLADRLQDAHGFDPARDIPADALVGVVSVPSQRLVVSEGGREVADFAVSTAARGVSAVENSHGTPPGWHRVAAAIGDGAPLGQVFVSRVPTGEVLSRDDWRCGGGDKITTRILWLEGLESGVNRGEGVDSRSRYIYLHGTNDESHLGLPVSHGCIRLSNEGVARLFDLVRSHPAGFFVRVVG